MHIIKGIRVKWIHRYFLVLKKERMLTLLQETVLNTPTAYPAEMKKMEMWSLNQGVIQELETEYRIYRQMDHHHSNQTDIIEREVAEERIFHFTTVK